MKIAIAVHGRFYAFDLARELLRRGNDVTLLTNYPASAVERFGFPRQRVRSFLLHGLVARAAWRLRGHDPRLYPEALVHRAFGRWVAGQISREHDWDFILAWSGVALEVLQSKLRGSPFRAVSRASSHIRTQARLLQEEAQRTGARQDGSSRWMIEREESEYARADGILVLSSFAERSFLDEGVPAEKLAVLPLGARMERFRAPPQIVEARCRRIQAGEPLRVLNVGAISFRKGLTDFAAVATTLEHENFDFRWVGPAAPEAAHPIADSSNKVTFLPHAPEASLPAVYAWGDVFLFPTIEDGYPVVLGQAAAGGLPIITTTNCSGPDLVSEGKTGWIVPIRSVAAIVERLRWCDAHRPALATLIRDGHSGFMTRDWSAVAADLEQLCPTPPHKVWRHPDPLNSVPAHTAEGR